jgi:hypothetical protein
MLSQGGVSASYAQTVEVKHFLQSSMTLKGCDLLYVVSPQTDLIESSVLAEFTLNPLQLTSATRLHQFAPLWDKFRWKRLCLRYKAACGTDTQGLLGAAAEPDVLDSYSNFSGLPLDQKLTSALHNISSAPNLPFSLDVRDKKFYGPARFMVPEPLSDPRNSAVGKIVITNQGALEAGTYGRFYLDWEIEFEQPNLDDSAESGSAFIQTISGSFVDATYPWGDFTAIKENTSNVTAFLERNYVTFESDATLGSVVRFRRPGYYMVHNVETGAAMGTGAYTSAAFSSGMETGWTPAFQGSVGLNTAIVNAGLTTREWFAFVTVNEANATLSSTGDAGVTHNTSAFSVSYFGDLPALDTPMVAALRSLIFGMQQQCALRNVTNSAFPPVKSSAGDLAVDNFGTISQGDGPRKVVNYLSEGTIAIGTPTDPIYIEPVPLKSQQKKKRVVIVDDSDDEA